MKKTNRESGFTLIELLVVIAIIGILSSVVLASLTTARGKGSNAAIKENLNNIRSQAEIVYDNAAPSYSYVKVCDDSVVWRGVQAAGAAAGVSYSQNALSGFGCSSSATGWVAFSALRTTEGSNTAWCVDGTGVSKGEPSGTTITASSTTACP